jgi:molybdenum cofactor sulfurtransferase
VDPHGVVWDCWEVERLANERRLSLRSGCHCNPGAREAALGFGPELRAYFEDKDELSYAEFVCMIKPSMQGVVRASLGLASNFKDAARLLTFARELIDRPTQ